MSPTADEVAFGSSLPVPSVQEMIRIDPSQVPDRYVRSEEDPSDAIDLSHLSSEIPVIDLSLLLQSQASELHKLDLACKDWGFFQVVNHGVEIEIMASMSKSATEFFGLPLEEKKKYSMSSNDIQGYGQAYVMSDEQKLDWSDILILVTDPDEYRKLKFWPTTLNNFKETVEVYSAEMRRVGEELLRALSVIMGMEKEGLIELHGGMMQALRLNYYPICSLPDKVLGISPHSDTSSLTILLQSNQVNGLQIRHDGGWVPVDAISNALIVNVGDILEIWTNGKYKSIEHRGVTNSISERLSFASFIGPSEDAEIEPIERSVDSEIKYKKVKYGDYLRQSMNRKMEGKTHTDVAKIQP